jgi:hypothetical protein
MHRSIAAIVCFSVFVSGCATAGGGRMTTAPAPASARLDPSLLTSYVKRLPIGSRVRVALTEGRRIKGILMQADDTGIVVQPRTRVPEAPIQIAADRILAVELETNGGVGKAIGVGIASGVGGALAFFLIMAAIFAGD